MRPTGTYTQSELKKSFAVVFSPISQKCESEYLEEQEERVVKKVSSRSGVPQYKWVMSGTPISSKSLWETGMGAIEAEELLQHLLAKGLIESATPNIVVKFPSRENSKFNSQ